jgi:hypothetical protein
LRLPPQFTQVADTDISATTMNADKVLKFSGPPPFILLAELETAWIGEIERELAQAAIWLHNHQGHRETAHAGEFTHVRQFILSNHRRSGTGTASIRQIIPSDHRRSHPGITQI